MKRFILSEGVQSPSKINQSSTFGNEMDRLAKLRTQMNPAELTEKTVGVSFTLDKKIGKNYDQKHSTSLEADKQSKC